MTGRIVQWDIDDARYVGDENDGVYYLVGEGPDGWYVTTVVDCNTAGFVDDLHVDDGPYPTADEAWGAGYRTGADWCITNDVAYHDDDDE